MKIINFKGKKDPLEVEDTQAQKLVELIASGSKEFVEVKGHFFSVDSIASIDPSRRYSEREPEPEKLVLTPEQEQAKLAAIKRVGDELRTKVFHKS